MRYFTIFYYVYTYIYILYSFPTANLLGFNLWGRAVVTRKCTRRKTGTALEGSRNLAATFLERALLEICWKLSRFLDLTNKFGDLKFLYVCFPKFMHVCPDCFWILNNENPGPTNTVHHHFIEADQFSFPCLLLHSPH